MERRSRKYWVYSVLKADIQRATENGASQEEVIGRILYNLVCTHTDSAVFYRVANDKLFFYCMDLNGLRRKRF